MLFIKRHTLSLAWKLMPVILTLRRLRQDDHHEFKTNLNYTMNSKTSLGEVTRGSDMKYLVGK